jgi:hypothetical protein
LTLLRLRLVDYHDPESTAGSSMNVSVDQLTSRYVTVSRSKPLAVKSKRVYVSTDVSTWPLCLSILWGELCFLLI